MAQSFHNQIKPLKQALRLVEAFRAADLDKDGSITVQELDRIKGLLPRYHSTKLENIKARMQRNEQLSISKFLDMNIEKLRAGDDFGKALKNGLKHMNSKRDALLIGEEVCEAIEEEGIQLSFDDWEDIVASIDGYGYGAISFPELEIIVNALV